RRLGLVIRYWREGAGDFLDARVLPATLESERVQRAFVLAAGPRALPKSPRAMYNLVARREELLGLRALRYRRRSYRGDSPHTSGQRTALHTGCNAGGARPGDQALAPTPVA